MWYWSTLIWTSNIIHFHCMENKSQDIPEKYPFCVPQKNEHHTGLKWYKAVQQMTIFTVEWSSPLRHCFLNIQRKLFEAATEQTHSSSFTSLASTPHGYIWPIKHGSRFLVSIPFTGWSLSPPDRYFSWESPPSQGRGSREEAANHSAPCCPNTLISKTPGALAVNIKSTELKNQKDKFNMKFLELIMQ